MLKFKKQNFNYTVFSVFQLLIRKISPWFFSLFQFNMDQYVDYDYIIIEEVKRRPFLFQKIHKLYQNVQARNEAWEMIADIIRVENNFDFPVNGEFDKDTLKSALEKYPIPAIRFSLKKFEERDFLGNPLASAGKKENLVWFELDFIMTRVLVGKLLLREFIICLSAYKVAEYNLIINSQIFVTCTSWHEFGIVVLRFFS